MTRFVEEAQFSEETTRKGWVSLHRLHYIAYIVYIDEEPGIEKRGQ